MSMKIKVGVVFGGKTVEHEVSIITALQAMNHSYLYYKEWRMVYRIYVE